MQDDSTKLSIILSNQINEIESKIRQLLDNINTNQNEKSNYINNYIEQCVQRETINLTNVIDQSVALNSSTMESLNTLNFEINKFVSENDTILEKYTKDELKRDVPTGKLFNNSLKL